MSIYRRLFHKGLLGGQNTEVSICRKVHHPWVVAKRLHTSGVEGAAEMLTTSKKASAPPVDTVQQPRCASIAGQRKHIARRPENHERILGKYSKQSFAI